MSSTVLVLLALDLAVGMALFMFLVRLDHRLARIEKRIFGRQVSRPRQKKRPTKKE